MPEPAMILSDHYKKNTLLQLATYGVNGPWICTVYYVADDENNLYWLSFPERRHSQDIAFNPAVAATVVVKSDVPVIGVQIEGIASVVTDESIVKSVMEQYVAKYNSGTTFYNRFVAGNNHHVMYKLTPTHTYLFDELNTSSSDRREVL